ncbi:IRX5 protein, partial [Regulus satrapa]|nr:IRX5 protein [Regulus satrapa]
YSTSVISGPRTDELGRSSSGSAFSPYAGSTAFTAPSPGYNSHLQYGTDPAAAAAAAFTSYVVRAAAGSRHRAGHDGIPRAPEHPPPPHLPGLLFVPVLFLRSRGQKGAPLPASRPNFPASPPCPASHCCWRQRRTGPGAGGASGTARVSRTRAGGDRFHSLNQRGKKIKWHCAAVRARGTPRGHSGCGTSTPQSCGHSQRPAAPPKNRRLWLSFFSVFRAELHSCFFPFSASFSFLLPFRVLPLFHLFFCFVSLLSSFFFLLFPLPSIFSSCRPWAGRSGPARPAAWARQCPFPNGAVLPRPLYYTAPFYPGYTNYGSFGALHGHPAGGPAAAAPGAHFNGLNQTVLSRAESLAKDTKMIRSQSQVDLCKDSPYELKKGMSNI